VTAIRLRLYEQVCSRETTVVIYDALFLTLAEQTGSFFLTADVKLLKTLQNTLYSGLARSLPGADSLL
jgi:predicted nucleic acid-binding protein